MRASKLEHAVQSGDSDGDFGRLVAAHARAQRVTDHPLETADRGLRQRTAIIVGRLLPADAPALGNQLQVPIALRRHRLDQLARHRIRSRRHDHGSIWMAIGDRAVNIVPVVRTVAGERGEWAG
jgi:hypothetical protein